jgi:hypothetical protein
VKKENDKNVLTNYGRGRGHGEGRSESLSVILGFYVMDLSLERGVRHCEERLPLMSRVLLLKKKYPFLLLVLR